MKIFPNVLKAHPIENLSGCLCQQVYEGEWEAKSEAQMIWRLIAKLKYSAETFLKFF
jgi:hypothetical protein